MSESDIISYLVNPAKSDTLEVYFKTSGHCRHRRYMSDANVGLGIYCVVYLIVYVHLI